MEVERYEQYNDILREELIPAMGCTEPIALAYAAAVGRQELGKDREALYRTLAHNGMCDTDVEILRLMLED